MVAKISLKDGACAGAFDLMRGMISDGLKVAASFAMYVSLAAIGVFLIGLLSGSSLWVSFEWTAALWAFGIVSAFALCILPPLVPGLLMMLTAAICDGLEFAQNRIALKRWRERRDELIAERDALIAKMMTGVMARTSQLYRVSLDRAPLSARRQGVEIVTADQFADCERLERIDSCLAAHDAQQN